ncbi:hypothetical protein G6F46_003121 [Rhizopus delemar]|uniref:DM2 domain-containing protein n=2 Tax=Rhizopus TaxID=4842 RepID=A0A9P7CQZ5_9FUNG|nr:hypothetical protein G6F55_003197 [Rhizopus delemar]KAG1550589.1 hypothetical protein G6F51_002356 [Rhizopus arrhizus]KAG1495086.1 hypothetical protein G6F54_007422 [Rhizopus delemar]KAG1514285.1 hypothetical protein G6F53_003795 [Rhizopus delemar]KAG1516447.1 hypothetical protein G6F52_009445 [Rhizopus delemar]
MQPHIYQGDMTQHGGMAQPQNIPSAALPYRKRPSEVESLSKHIKKKRPTDKNLSPKIESFAPESKLYTELVEFEKKLDATIVRKKLDIQEALGKPTKIRRTLRLFISNTVTPVDQQQELKSEDNAFDLNNNNAPSWTLKIEGKLLDSTNADDNSKKVEPTPKMTSFFRTVSVELDRDPSLYPEGNVIEWQKQPNSTTEYDKIEIKRKGDMNTNCRIMLHLDHNPQRYKLSPSLSDLLDAKVENKLQIVMGIWNYCKVHKLQDHEDKRIIRCDNRLAQLFGYPQVHFSQIPELINQHLTRPDPIVIDYTIRVDKQLHLSSKAYDIDVEMDSIARQKMVNIVSSNQIQKEIMAYDDKIVQCVQSINNSKVKRDFLLQFSKEPIEFINKWIASQARDLEVILGESKVNVEEIKQTDFYKQPWMKEAVFHYLTTKTQQRMQELLTTQR